MKGIQVRWQYPKSLSLAWMIGFTQGFAPGNGGRVSVADRFSFENVPDTFSFPGGSWLKQRTLDRA